MSYPSELPDQSNIQAYYLAKDYDYSTGKWHDILDNHVTSATTSGRPTLTDDPVNSKFKYLAFTASPNTKITLGSNLFSGNNSSNQTYTLFTVARRGKTISSNGTFGSYDAQGRIIDANNTNALFGWWDYSEGVFYVNTSIDEINSSGDRGYEKNWAICAIRRKQNVGDGQQNKCWSMGFKGGNGGPYPGSGASREPSTGYHITDKDNNTAVTGLRLNHNEQCDFHVGEILFYKTNLSDTDVETVIDYLASRYFGTNSEGSNGTGNITFAGSGGTVGPLDISLGITGWYDGYSYDNSNSKWTDKTGLGNDLSGTDITGTLTPSVNHFNSHLVSYRNNKKYMQKMFKYIAGSTTSRINFPTGFLADTSYTLFHVARRDPNSTNLNGRIFDGGITEYILEAGAGGRNGTGGAQGSATAHGKFNTEYDAPEAFDGNITSASDSWVGAPSTPSGMSSISNQELRFLFPTEKYITKYIIWPRRYNGQWETPTEWQLRGVSSGTTYNPGVSSTYTIISQESNQSWSAFDDDTRPNTDDITNKTRCNEYLVDNPGSYIQYILHVTDVISSGSKPAIGQMAYYSSNNWYSGFNDASSGVTAHDLSYVNTTDRKYGNNWVVSVDRPNYYRSIGYSDFSSGYYDISSGSRTDNASPSSVPQLTINNGSTTLSSCDWNVAEVFAYNKHLSGSEEDSLADYLKFKYLGTNQVSTGDPHIYQLTHDISAVDASNTQQMIKGLPPDISAQTSIIGWYTPESYNSDISGFWKDYSGHDNDLSNCGTSPEFVDKDSSYNWISYIRGSKGTSYSDASGFIFPENLLPTDGAYTIIHVSRRVKDASGNATGRIFDSASNKNFYSGFVGSKSGVALHSVDVSASGTETSSGSTTFPTTNPYYNASNAGPPNFIELAASDFVSGGSRYNTNLPYYGLGHTHTWPISTFINNGGQKEGYDSINLDNSAPGNDFIRNPNSDQSPALNRYVTQVYWIWWRTTDSDWRTLWRGNSDHWIIVQSGNKNLGMYSNRSGGFRDSGLDITTGKWQFVACVSTGTSATSNTGTGIYYIGNLGENNLTQTSNYTIDRVPCGTYFYRMRWGGGQDPGWIAYTAIWSGSDSKYALSRTELEELYKQGIPRAGVAHGS